ncbi:MAG: pro-sigmaK processing inhibitor BofA family protein [Oscillospiraceae bacterium]|nr:pro-sigmaK processing inhibitor BofA family protein [Oscillospiraceae bacterium]
MNDAYTTLAILGGVAVLSLIFMLRLGRFWMGWLFSAVTGLIAFGLVNLTAGQTGVALPVSLLSLGVSAVGGMPGVVVMLALRLLWPV